MKQGVIDRAYARAISEFLIEGRRKSRRTLEEVGQIVDVGTVTLHRYETGQREIPLNLFKKLCVLYGFNFEKTFREISQKATEYVVEEMSR